MAAAHDARTEPPQALPAPADCTRYRRCPESHAHETQLPSGNEHAVSLRQQLLDEVGGKQIEDVGRNEVVEGAIWLRYTRGAVSSDKHVRDLTTASDAPVQAKPFCR